MLNHLLTLNLRAELDEVFYEPVKTTKPPPQVKWVIPVTFTVGPLLEEEETKIVRNSSENLQNGTWLVLSPESAASRAALLYESGSPSERALLLDDAFVLSRARRLPASRAVAAAEHHWAVWRVAISHLSWWRQLLRLAASAPDFTEMLSTLTSAFTVYSKEEIDEGNLNEDQLWLSGALLTASVEWGNFKEMFGTESGASIALDTIALNSAWISRADADLLRYFQAVRKH
ncbi:unnamed protein product [Leptidea sinapis]|uniref:Uncharacterized protein n=1 Tax=Leptidea sinapis TaxID=189913 RepID=A0A5E4Q119_9NEOP|nr:unnamed protein product [Leptidea sinapis]